MKKNNTKTKKKITKATTPHKPIEQYEHKDKQRVNNPPVGLVDAQNDPENIGTSSKKKTYQYDPHLDPQLQWASKAEHTSFDVPTVSLHVHERIDPRRIIEAVKKEEETPNQTKETVARGFEISKVPSFIFKLFRIWPLLRFPLSRSSYKRLSVPDSKVDSKNS